MRTSEKCRHNNNNNNNNNSDNSLTSRRTDDGGKNIAQGFIKIAFFLIKTRGCHST